MLKGVTDCKLPWVSPELISCDTVKNNHKPGGLEHWKGILSQIWGGPRSEVKVLAGLQSPHDSRGDPVLCLCQPLGAAGIAWLVVASLWSLSL